jgi:hypothetical protein
MFALLVPLFIAIGAIVVTIGNWYVLKRHLQTQVDAAALASGPAFTGCYQDPVAARDAIALAALQYSGDPTRAPTTSNLLMQDAPDVHVVLNSSAYWASGDDPNGVGRDWTIATPGTPCETQYLDVKATDDSAPLLWGWIPFTPSLETRAKVRISKVENTNGLRPLGVPENDPEQLAVLIVDEADGSIKGRSLLDSQSTPPTGLADLSVWSRDFIAPVDLSGDRDFGVIIVASRSTTPLDLNQSLSQICSPSSGQVECYAGATPTSGISFIHAYSTTGTGGDGTPNPPIVRGVSLGGGCAADRSKPYFNYDGSCPLTITAEVDFGTGSTDPRPRASLGGVCAGVSSPQVQGSGQLTWAGGLWTGTVNAAADGRTPITLSWDTDTNGACGGPGGQNGTFGKVAAPYAADAGSGPVQYLTVERAGGAGLANSIAGSASASLKVTVGLTPPLREGTLTDPPIVLRGWGQPSQTQALDCGSGSGPIGWAGAMQNGCVDPYQIYDQSKHVSKCGPPPTGVPAADPKDCIDSQNGNFNENRVRAMYTPCAANPNRWDGMTIPPAWDKRWMPLFVLDQMAFEVSGKRTYPIRRFGMFYITAVSSLNCPGDDPATVPSGKEEIWGHFMSFITPGFGQTIPSDEPCSFGDGSLCVSNLVE